MEKNIVNPGILNKITNNSDAIANLQSGLAYIVGNTNATGVSLAVGQYVYVKGHSTIPEGLRKVKGSSAIANGESITTNNTEAVSEGGLNSLFSKIALQDLTENLSTEVGTFNFKYCNVELNHVTVQFEMVLTSEVAARGVLISGMPYPKNRYVSFCISGDGGIPQMVYTDGGNLKASTSFSSGDQIAGILNYIKA